MTPPSTRRSRPRGHPGSTRQAAGFTLIELMIAVAVIGILASIAYPSYTRYVQEARRTDAISTLATISGQLERCYTVANDYTDDSCPSGNDIPSEEGFYLIDISATAATYSLVAEPDANKSQSSDSCGSFSLNHQGVRSPDDCW